MITRHYSKKITATTTEQSFILPSLVEFHVLNAGNDNVFIEPDNEIDADSILIPAGMSVTFKSEYINLNYKANSSTAILYVYGTRHWKE